MSETQVNSFTNLLYLCHRHHKEVDADTDTFSVEALREMKRNHESQKDKPPFHFDFDRFISVNRDFQQFWKDVQHINNKNHIVPDLRIRINTSKTFNEIIEDIKTNLAWVRKHHKKLHDNDMKLFEDIKAFSKLAGDRVSEWDSIPYYDNPFQDRNWEIHNLGIPNFLNITEVLLLQLELKYYEEYMKTNSTDSELDKRVVELKKQIKFAAERAGLID